MAAVNDLSHKKTTHADFQGLINSWSKVDWDVDNRGECLGAVLLGKTIHTIIYQEIICREQTSYYISEVDIFAVCWLWMRVSKFKSFLGEHAPVPIYLVISGLHAVAHGFSIEHSVPMHAVPWHFVCDLTIDKRCPSC